GLIVVDEEHESSYKQYDMVPHYHARDVALVRGKKNNAVVLLGSATPSAESFFNTQQKKYTLLELPERVDNAKLPEIKIVDMRKGLSKEQGAGSTEQGAGSDQQSATSEKQAKEIKQPYRSSLSSFLREHIEDRLKKNEGIILLQNRRGFSAFVECTTCGNVEVCKNCSVSLTYHLPKQLLRCHYCGFSEKLPLLCPKCGSPRVLYKGIGTQKVEEELKRHFPAAKVVRMDLDTTKGKGSHETILRKFGEREYDILLGTQMVAKGLDFPHVTLVGVISADLQMLLPDFRAAERTFQLLTQVAGRAGRSSLAGEVVIQTYQPEHYCLNYVVNNDVEKFLSVEFFHRKERLYPPFSRIAMIEFRGKKENEVSEHANVFSHLLKNSNGTLHILGPAPPLLFRLNGMYRIHILLKSPREKDTSGTHLHSSIRKTIQLFKETEYGKSKQVKMIIDIDPMGMM
ncbi:MAG: primosomal protein N', partial [Ignavibacteriales bacterium]|nr:primosomal protein N' [Ignavibacteriales bacterium]